MYNHIPDMDLIFKLNKVKDMLQFIPQKRV